MAIRSKWGRGGGEERGGEGWGSGQGGNREKSECVRVAGYEVG